MKPLNSKPLILAPAGHKAGFLAALAAGAEAIYCGLKELSARMEAKNFTLDELAGLTDLAHQKGTGVYVTINTFIKPEELNLAGKFVDDLNRRVKPDALIIQDLALVELARQTGFAGELHLSTLANISFGAALPLISRLPGVSRVILPRELNIDEIKKVAGLCPERLGLEVFVHGALCYGISGRCYWSSFLGGKSGLRGRCVQPCRRLYQQGKDPRRYFSCLDLSLDVLVKLLLPLPAIKAWKIEGRKKGPHYVYYLVRAYRLLRDHHQDPQARKEALTLISRALGRSGTHYGILSQRPQNPIQLERQTGSGLLLGRTEGHGRGPCLILKEDLFPGDILRLGYEDEPGHRLLKIDRPLSAGSRFFLDRPAGQRIGKGSPVFLIDRREPDLVEKTSALEKEIKSVPAGPKGLSGFQARLPEKSRSSLKAVDQQVFYRAPKHPGRGETGIWLSEEVLEAGVFGRDVWCWLTPALWPEEEADFQAVIDRLLKKGQRKFVLNAPWQTVFFPEPERLSLWAGPFCNLSNPLALKQVKSYGFSGAIVSPELGQSDFLALPAKSPLPLGIVLAGTWPLCISRIDPAHLKADRPFQSPRGEAAWVTRQDSNYWVYPNWELDLTSFRRPLEQAGYRVFVRLNQPLPPGVKLKDRPGLWNWKIGLP
jgi:putative protease